MWLHCIFKEDKLHRELNMANLMPKHNIAFLQFLQWNDKKINITLLENAETISFDKLLILKKYFYFWKNKKNQGNFKSQNIILEGFGVKDLL